MPITLAFFEDGFSDILFTRLLWGVIPVVLLVLIVTLIVRVIDRRNKAQGGINTMLAEDKKANNIRSKNIDENHFYKPNIAELPTKKYTEEEIASAHPIYIWQKKSMAAADKKMIHFKEEFTNIELKKMFGTANLEFIARYEENFTNFIHALRHWGQALLKEGQQDDAQKVLEFAIEAGSEISQTYILLSDIYAAQRNTRALIALKNTLDTRNMPGKKTALDHIETLL